MPLLDSDTPLKSICASRPTSKLNPLTNMTLNSPLQHSRSLRDLVAACYGHVAPQDIDFHINRLEAFAHPNPVLSTPDILNHNNTGIGFADLFCGAGGLSLGFELEGAVCRYALDHDSSALETFAINRPANLEIVCADIENVLKGETHIKVP